MYFKFFKYYIIVNFSGKNVLYNLNLNYNMFKWTNKSLKNYHFSLNFIIDQGIKIVIMNSLIPQKLIINILILNLYENLNINIKLIVIIIIL